MAPYRYVDGISLQTGQEWRGILLAESPDEICGRLICMLGEQVRLRCLYVFDDVVQETVDEELDLRFFTSERVVPALRQVSEVFVRQGLLIAEEFPEYARQTDFRDTVLPQQFEGLEDADVDSEISFSYPELHNFLVHSIVRGIHAGIKQNVS